MKNSEIIFINCAVKKRPKQLLVADLSKFDTNPLFRRNMLKRILLLCFLLGGLAAGEASAQRFTRGKRYTSIGFSVNAMNYFGDITPTQSFTSTDLEFTRYNLGVSITRRLTPRFSIRGMANYGRLRGDDYRSQDPTDDDARFRYLRNASFRTSIYEASVTGIFDLVENRQSYLRRPDFVPYLFVGVGGFYFNPRSQAPADFGGPGTWVALQPLRTEGVSYSLIQVNVPFGVGFRYKASPRWDISFEIGYRYLFTDYLDDVSGNYADPSTLPSPLARAMANRTTEINSANGSFRDLNRVLNDIGYSVITKRAADGSLYRTVNGYEAAEKRGSPNEKDWYLVTGFHFNYILVKGVRCPKFR